MDQNENVPMYYRTSFDKQITRELSLYSYLKNTTDYNKHKNTKNTGQTTSKNEIVVYNFDSTMEYYDNRDEYEYVGIIDKEISRRKNKLPEEIKDVFKIRERRAKILDKKRGTGIPSLKGAVCSTSKSKEYLEKIAEKLSINFENYETREDICGSIKKEMLLKEKYSTGKNKMTYIMIPANHPEYPFPYNLEDRVEYIIDEIKSKIKYKINIDISQHEKKKNQTYYDIRINHDEKLDEYEKIFQKYNAKKEKKEWVIRVE